MNIKLVREVFAETFTLGRLYVDGKQFGFTCEDKDRKLEEGGEKVDIDEFKDPINPRNFYNYLASNIR